MPYDVLHKILFFRCQVLIAIEIPDIVIYVRELGKVSGLKLVED